MPDDPKKAKPKAVTDTVAPTDGYIAVLKHGDTVRSVRTHGAGEHAVAADVGEHQDVVLRLAGPPSHGEENVRRVAEILVQRLNADGGSWGEPRNVASQNVRRESGIDFEVDGPARALLRAQVTRANPSRQLWACLAEVGRIQGRFGLKESADALRDAIQRKQTISPADRRVLCLVLDATLVAGHALGPVIEEFRRRHGEWARDLGFQAIWCVGPVPELVWRLDEA